MEKEVYSQKSNRAAESAKASRSASDRGLSVAVRKRLLSYVPRVYWEDWASMSATWSEEVAARLPRATAVRPQGKQGAKPADPPPIPLALPPTGSAEVPQRPVPGKKPSAKERGFQGGQTPVQRPETGEPVARAVVKGRAAVCVAWLRDGCWRQRATLLLKRAPVHLSSMVVGMLMVVAARLHSDEVVLQLFFVAASYDKLLKYHAPYVKRALRCLVQRGRTRVVRRLLSTPVFGEQRNAWLKDFLSDAEAGTLCSQTHSGPGHPSCVQMFVAQCDLDFARAVCASAARCGHLHCMDAALQKMDSYRGTRDRRRFRCANALDETLCRNAAAGGHVSCLVRARQSGAPWNEDACATAAQHGHLHCLVFLHENGCPWDERTPISAAANGHAACLCYVLDSGCPASVAVCRAAATGGSVDCLHAARERGCPWDASTPAWAAARGNLGCLGYALQNGCPRNEQVAELAALADSLPCLRYAYEHGCPVSADTLQTARKFGSRLCAQYLEPLLSCAGSAAATCTSARAAPSAAAPTEAGDS